MQINSIKNFISKNRYPSFVNSLSDVEIIHQRKEKPSFDINQEINNRTFIRPLAPKGHIIKNGFLSAPLNLAQEAKTNIVALTNAAKGNADDYQLGKLNDFGMKLGGLAIAAYLFSMKHAPVTKAMEFIGFGSFFASMALWPKIALDIPARLIHGFNPFMKYEDSQGRIKGFFSDNQYIPFDTLSEKEINRVGKRLNIPANIPNRREAIEEKMRKIALQNNTMWMLTAGFATPIMSSLICNVAEPLVENIYNANMNKRIDRILDNFSQSAKKYTTPEIGIKVDKIISKNKEKPITSEIIEELSSALSMQLDDNIKLGIKKDLSKILLDGTYNLSETQVNEIYNTTSKLIEISAGNKLSKATLSSIIPNEQQIKNLFISNGYMPSPIKKQEISVIKSKISEIIAQNIKKININKRIIEPHFARKLTTSVNNPALNKGIKSIEEILTSTPNNILDSTKQDLIKQLSNIITNFSAENYALDKYAYHKLALAPDTAKAKYWNDITRALIKILNINPKEIENTRYDRKLVIELFNNKIWQKATSNDSEYKKFIENIASKISQIDKYIKPDEINGRYLKQVEDSFNTAAKDLKDIGFYNTAKRIIGENSVEAGTLIGVKKAFVRDNLTNVQSTFSALLNKINVYRTIYKNPDLKFLTNEAIPKEIKEETVALAEYLTSEGRYGDYAVKFDFLRNLRPNKSDIGEITFKNGKISYEYYNAEALEKTGVFIKSDVNFFKRVMKLLFGSPVNPETREILSKYSSVSKMLDTYRANMLNFVGNVENYMYPDHITGNWRQYSKTSSKMNSNMTGAPLDEMLTNAIRKSYNSKKWLRKFGGFGIGLLGITIMAQFLFGKSDKGKDV